MSDTSKNTVRRYCIWNRMYGDIYMSETIFSTRKDAEDLIASMPAYFRSQGKVRDANDWEKSEHVIVEANVKVPPFFDDMERVN